MPNHYIGDLQSVGSRAKVDIVPGLIVEKARVWVQAYGVLSSGPAILEE
jgi:hypothetical protein